MKIISKAYKKDNRLQERILKHGSSPSKFCIRFVEAVFLMSLVAFLLTTVPPFIWMLRADKESSSSSQESRLIPTQIQKIPVARAVIEPNRQVYKVRMSPQIEKQDNKAINHQWTRDPQPDNKVAIPDQQSDDTSTLGLSQDIKVYVYDLPSEFNQDWLADPRCSSHLFAAEVAIHQNMLRSPVRTLDPDKADYFFVPVYVSCNFSPRTGFPYLSQASAMLESSVALISQTMPYWNKHQGRDHVFVATHDFGACFHAMEDIAIAMGIPHFLRNSIILQTFGQKNGHPCQNVDHILIPPYVVPLEHWPNPKAHKRNILAFFRGKMEIHPKNVSGHMYSRGVRTIIWRKFSRDRRFFVKRKRSNNYGEEMLRSVFCLCPLGWAPWSPRIVESVIYGCVPVIIADKIELPYSNVINWSQISVTVAEKDVHRLDKILNKVAATNLSTIQNNLWKDQVRKALVFQEPSVRGDATWQVLDLLARRKRASQVEGSSRTIL